MVFAAVLLLLFVSASLAEDSKYQLYSESKGLLGGRRVIMLDKTTGDSWLYTDNKWVPILKTVAEVKSADDDAKAKLAAELAALNDKQSQEIKTLKDKQETELGVLREKLEAKKAPEARASQPAVKARPIYAKKKTTSAAKSAQAENEGSDTEAPPAWLNE
jgi:hypothetical protein